MCLIQLSFLTAFVQSAVVHELTGEVMSIADGNTMSVSNKVMVQRKIRLKGICFPGKGQTFPTNARRVLDKRVHRERVRVNWREEDGYGQILGEVHPRDRHINRKLFADELAWRCRKFSQTTGNWTKPRARHGENDVDCIGVRSPSRQRIAESGSVK
jgi:endonuclease YncB( thermonuclease family)